MPIRVHTGVQRRGRKLADWKQSLINQAVREIRQRERKGETVSVREVAERYRVSKSTLHRYLRSTHTSPSDSSSRQHQTQQRPRSMRIDFLINNDASLATQQPHF